MSDGSTPRPKDLVNRQFAVERPNALWLTDFAMYRAGRASSMSRSFNVFPGGIVGWRVSSSANSGFVLDALEQALYERQLAHQDGLIRHSDRSVQYVPTRYSDRLVDAGIEPSVGSVSDSHADALVQTINGLYQAEVIHRPGPWRNLQAVEMAMVEWADEFNNRRLLGPIGDIPPAETGSRLVFETH
jgi:transposase InsO family protein